MSGSSKNGEVIDDRLGAILETMGLVSGDEVRAAIAYRSQVGGHLGDAFVTMGLITQEQLDSAIATQSNLREGNKVDAIFQILESQISGQEKALQEVGEKTKEVTEKVKAHQQ